MTIIAMMAFKLITFTWFVYNRATYSTLCSLKRAPQTNNVALKTNEGAPRTGKGAPQTWMGALKNELDGWLKKFKDSFNSISINCFKFSSNYSN